MGCCCKKNQCYLGSEMNSTASLLDIGVHLIEQSQYRPHSSTPESHPDSTPSPEQPPQKSPPHLPVNPQHSTAHQQSVLSLPAKHPQPPPDSPHSESKI